MVTMRDRALIEARAKGLDIEALVKNHWRQLLKADIIISALAVSIMLLIYYAAGRLPGHLRDHDSGVHAEAGQQPRLLVLGL